MSEPLRSLHIGVGGRGHWPLHHAASAGFQPVALCDTSEESLAAAREMTGLDESACFTEPAAAMEDGGIDCVIVCTPTRLHVPLAKLALEHGLPVLVEKGMAPDFETALDLVRAADRARIPVCVAQNYRYNAVERTFARCLHNPDDPHHPGPIHSVNYIQHRVRPEPRTLNYPFASVWDMSCHHFDNLLFWLGPIARMTATSYAAPWSAYTHDNNTAALMRFESGAAVTYEHTHDAARAGLAIEFHGECGALWLAGKEVKFSQRPTEQFGSRPVQDVPAADAPAERGVLADFRGYILDGAEPGISAKRNLEVMAMCQMMVQSISEDRGVHREDMPALNDGVGAS